MSRRLTFKRAVNGAMMPIAAWEGTGKTADVGEVITRYNAIADAATELLACRWVAETGSPEVEALRAAIEERDL